MRKLFSIVLVLFNLLIYCNARRYEYLSYNEMLDKMKELSVKYSRYCKLHDVKKAYNYVINSYCGKSNCEHWYLTISDFNAPPEKTNALPQVFFLGGIHGDESVGPNVLIHLAEYLLQKNEEDQDITNLVKSRFIILLPMANPSGYYYRIREERQISGITLDPNRDFPYNLVSKKCFNSASARVINHIVKTHLIQAAITFHGGDHSITYPWGAFNHIQSDSTKNNPKAEECPDDKAFSDIARILSKEAGSNSNLFIKPYPTGKMTDTVYAVNGGLEDWIYGASWETKFSPDVIPTCDTTHQEVPLPASETQYNSQSLRTLIYLIEISNPKQPATAYLGSSEGLYDDTDTYAYGYIAMNIKLCLSLIDIVEPYVKITSLDYSEEGKTLTIEWQGGGCKTVDETYLQWNNTEGKKTFSNTTPPKQGPGFYDNKNFKYQEIINLNTTQFNMNFTIKLTCDQSWSSQQSPAPATGPQTHVVQSRLNQDYYAEANGYKVFGKKIVEVNMKEITLEYLERTRVKNLRDMALYMDFLDCSTSLSVGGSVTARLVNNVNKSTLQFTGMLNVEDSFLEGHLHQYGDISRCPDSVGGVLNIIDLEDDKSYEKSLLFTMQKDGVKTSKINYKLALGKEANMIEMIGRSVLLERTNHPDKIYVGQVYPVQPDSCKKADEMKDCIGVALGPRSGVCTVKVPLEEAIRDFKLFIQPGIDGKSININGFIPNKIMESYYKFEEIYIVHEKTEKKFFIDKKSLSGYGLIKQNTFNLYPDIALGTLLRVYIIAFGDKFLLGDCAVGLRDPTFDEIKYIEEHAPNKLHDDAVIFRRQIFFFLLIVSVLILLGVLINFVAKRYREVKLQSFEGAMSARKERYADTARMIGSARDGTSAGRDAVGSNRNFGAINSTSPRLFSNVVANANRGGAAERRSESDLRKIARMKAGNHIVLPEEQRDDEAYNEDLGI